MERTNSDAVHVPVLLEEVIAHIALRPGDDAVDCTYGAGGYSAAMLAASAPDGRVLAIDWDPSVRAATLGDRLVLIHGSFGDVGTIAQRYGFTAPRAIVADLGLSSLQLADSNRGFSFQGDGPLDMRFSAGGGSASGGDPTSDAPTAAEFLRRTSMDELVRVLREYGEEPHARAIAAAIVRERRKHPIATTAALADLIARVSPRRGKMHPATRTFQALRIAVNDELGELARTIPQMLELVAPGGRIAIVTFHSLEDRIVKQAFRDAEDRGWGRRVVKKPIRPTDDEIARNPRSRSAKLRVVERASLVQ